MSESKIRNEEVEYKWMTGEDNISLLTKLVILDVAVRLRTVKYIFLVIYSFCWWLRVNGYVLTIHCKLTK